jgi:uncharacterized protein (DUF983 family)
MYYGRMKLSSIVRLRCLVCGEGELFKGFFDSPERCPKCGYYVMRESGYFLPHVAIGYLATVLVALGCWPLLYYAGVRSAAVTLTVMIAAALVFGIWFIRYAKILWMAFDLYMNPAVKEDFEGRGRS